MERDYKGLKWDKDILSLPPMLTVPKKEVRDYNNSNTS